MSTTSSLELPAAVDISHHFSELAKQNAANPFKAFYRFFQLPGVGNLAGGMPNYNYFPFDTLEGIAAWPERFKPTPTIPVNPPKKEANPDAGSRVEGSRVIVPKVSPDANPLTKIDVKTSLQYGDAHGLPPLYAWIKKFTLENLHPNIPYKDGPEVLMTTGNTDGFAKALEALMNQWKEGFDAEEDRPGMLVEQYTYTPPAIRAKAYKANIVPVAMDRQGMMATGEGGLEDVLENWDFSRGRRPHLLYTVTIGQNPTGCVLGVKRRKEIYKICVKYDVIIIEDEPYWYLQYPSANALSIKARGYAVSEDAQPGCQKYASTGYEFLDSLVPSFLSIDYQGRVVRLDTFSKTVAPGCRLGWITAQPALIEKIYLSTQQTTQQPSGFVQSMIAQLILGTEPSIPPYEGFFSSPNKNQNGWKTDGWVRWLEGLRGNYERRMNTMCNLLEENKYIIKTGRRRKQTPHRSETQPAVDASDDAEEWRHIIKQQIYDFDYPMGGMFTWVRLNLETHPMAGKYSHEKLAAAQWILFTREPYRVLPSPGLLFSANDAIQAAGGYQFFRVCFAAVHEAEIEPLTQKLVDGFHAFWSIKTEEEIDDLIEESPWMQARMEGLAL